MLEEMIKRRNRELMTFFGLLYLNSSEMKSTVVTKTIDTTTRNYRPVSL